MIIIAHRGNLEGSKPDLENTVEYLEAALHKGFDVEADVWWKDGAFFLGHDHPGQVAPLSFLKDRSIWCHAKDALALDRLLAVGAHCFSHDKDEVVLTSFGYLWTYPGKTLTPMSIAVLPERVDGWAKGPKAGVCTDFVSRPW